MLSMPADPTPAQSEASRLNALRSTGPVTEAGRAASSRNAVRHGLRGATIEVLPEEQGLLVELMDSLSRRWRPADAVEHGLVQAMALVELKLARLDTVELQVLAASVEEPDGKRLPSLNTLVRYRSRLLKERWEAEYRLRTAIEQRRTNEAEALQEAVAESRQGLTMGAPGGSPSDPLTPTQGAPLNREQRRRLAAVQRRAA
jgi:hypothetical protein